MIATLIINVIVIIIIIIIIIIIYFYHVCESLCSMLRGQEFQRYKLHAKSISSIKLTSLIAILCTEDVMLHFKIKCKLFIYLFYL